RIDLIVGDAPPDNAPTAVADAATLSEDGTTLIDVLANDTDPDGDALVISSPGSASHGSVAIESGKVRYTPAANYFGSDAFTYQISDGRGGFASASVAVTVLSVNDPPRLVSPAPAGNTTLAVAVPDSGP